jgi:alpha-glucosidase
MKDFGYDVADYCDVDPIFGTLADFDVLVERAHSLGLKVIIDQVYSHTSDAHAWFRESRASKTNAKADWYVWADAKPDGSPPNNWQAVFGGASWTWDARREQYYMHNFLAEQPDLNVHNPDVQDALLATARFWFDRGVDGFRLDAINFAMHDPKLRSNPAVKRPKQTTRPFDFQRHVYSQSHKHIPRFLKRIRALCDDYGGRMTIAEVGGPLAEQEMRDYTRGQSRLNTAYGFDFLYADALTPEVIKTALAKWPGKEGEGWPSWAFSNHDAPRVVSRWAAGRDARAISKLCLALLFTMRGNPFLYQGEELGLPQANVPFDRLQDPEAIMNWPQTLGRDGARTPIPWTTTAPWAGFSDVEPWLPVDPVHLPLSVEAAEDDPDASVHLVRKVLALRKQYPALATCVFNLGDADAVFEAPACTPLFTLAQVSPETLTIPALGGYIAIITQGARKP